MIPGSQILDLTVYKDEDGKRKPGYHIHFLRWNNRFHALHTLHKDMSRKVIVFFITDFSLMILLCFVWLMIVAKTFKT